MSEVTKFAPSVLIDGVTYTPRGWEWVLGFAVGGCQWAIDEANTPEFQARVKRDLALNKAALYRRDIEIKKRDIERMEEEVKRLEDLANCQSTRALDLVEFVGQISKEYDGGYQATRKLDLVDEQKPQ